MPAISKAAANREMIARTVVAALRTQGPQVIEEIQQRLYDGNPPANLTLEQFILDLADYLEGSTARSNQLSAAVINEEAQDVTATEAERKALEGLIDEIQWQRERISGTYNPKVAHTLGFSGTIPRTTDELVALSTTLIDGLESGQFPQQTHRGRPALDRQDVIARIESARVELEEAARSDEREKRETQQARDERNTSDDDWTLDYRGIANTAFGLFTLARKVELADKVRPTARRRKGLPEEDDLDEPNEPNAPQPADDDVVEPVAE